MPRLKLRFFGGFFAQLAAEPITTFESAKVRALLAYLVIEGDRPHHRESLLGLFWPEMPEDAARQNLRQALFNLRRSIGDTQADAPLIIATRDTVHFDPAAEIECDVRQFEAGLAAYRQTKSIEPLEQVAALYRGPLLDQLILKDSPAFDEWLLVQREHYSRAALEALSELAQAYEAQGELAKAIQQTQRELEIAPWLEEAHQHLMLLLDQSGQRSKALAQYELCRKYLIDELAIEPSDHTRKIFESLQRGEHPAGLAPFRFTHRAPNIIDEPPTEGEPPFKGLQFFDEADADLFFGREQLTAHLLDQFRQSNFLAIVGASGSGKSSIVRAGLLPAIRSSGLDTADRSGWQIRLITPTEHPLESIAAAFKDTVDDDTPLVLVIDQLEELFTLCKVEAERKAFIDAITLMSRASTRVVVTLRADFYANCAQYTDLRDRLADNQIYLGPMTVTELRQAIEEPARRGSWQFEPGLVDLLLRDVGASENRQPEPGALPLLSHALLETWQRRRGRVMTLQGYAESGGVQGAIARTADAVYQDQLSPDQQIIARQIFLRLTELGEAGNDTRRRVALKELMSDVDQANTVDAVLRNLIAARLVITSEGSAEVAHEALIREWPALRQWLVEDREGLKIHRALTQAAARWNEAGFEESELYRGARLAQAIEWAEVHDSALNDVEKKFLTASKLSIDRELAEREIQRQHELEAAQQLAQAEKVRAEEQAHSARRLRRRAIGLTIALSAIVLLGLVAAALGVWANRAAQLATSRELASAAISNFKIDPERSILLALHAVSIDPTDEAVNALHRALIESRLQLTLRGHSSEVVPVSYSPDGRQLATGALDCTVRIWDAITGQPVSTLQVCPPLSGGVFELDYSPDGQRLITAGGDSQLQLWEIATGKKLWSIKSEAGLFYSVAFSPDGTRVVAGGDNPQVKIFDASTGQELQNLTGPADVVLEITFSPDGSRVASAGVDNVAIVWDSVTGKQLLSVPGERVAFSPNGQQLLTVNADFTAPVLWDSVTGERLVTFLGHTNVINAVTFSRDGSQVATASLDGTARIWDAASGRELITLWGHVIGVNGVAISPDGQNLATTGSDGTARVWNIGQSRELLTIPVGKFATAKMNLSPDGSRVTEAVGNDALVWDTTTGQLLLTLHGHAQIVTYAIYSPDGKRIATTCQDGTAKIWDANTGQELLTLTGHKDRVSSAAFSSDSRRLVTTSRDGTAMVWDSISGQRLLTLSGHKDGIMLAAFSPDGKQIATASADYTAKVWDADSGQSLMTFSNHRDVVWGVAFSHDGQFIATASRDGTAKIWDAHSGAEILTLTGHTSTVVTAMFSPDDKSIATSSRDGTAKIWNAQTGKEELTLYGDGSGLNRVVFSPDGNRLVLGSTSGIRFYTLKLAELIALARSRVTRALTTDECVKYLHVLACP
jgi:WD40 repeat protein/DNA-binding SARP family transcriptional activator